jgi:hypothetical protein
MALIDHIPKGNPCAVCGEDAFLHRVEHIPDGDICTRCGLPASRHRVRNRKAKKRDALFLGIDGEGQGRDNHKYVLLAASTEDGQRQWWIDDPRGLSTVECLDFLLELPSYRTKAFAYSFNYDLTKILTDLDDETLWLLARPELRQRRGEDSIKGPRPVYWNGYQLNLQGTKFTVARGTRRRVVWDVFKFFQSKFVGALKDWKVGSQEMLDRMQHMKDKRADFDKESPEAVLAYCLEECQYMAELARKLTDAHTDAGLKLKNYYGAGSSASAMLDVMGIKEKIVSPPDEMMLAVAAAFFGGRFENSVIGEIIGTVYNYDISSAYPYQLCFLPCLEHGEWSYTENYADLADATAALVHYGLGKPSAGISDWGPFPFRSKDGSICFPVTSGGGWVWKDEFLAGARLFPHVEFRGAWIYKTDCNCQPFKDIPFYYSERVRIGKEGPGIVLKLGCNSCYGKLAQSVGKAIYNSWVWAGMITSGCRAQILEIMGLHKDRANLLMIATDGIYTREKLETPQPKDTGTWSTGKPLGGWEEDIITKGVFVARPGIYFPLNPTKKEIKKVRGRGVGKGVVLENWQRIVDAWNLGREGAEVANVSRFCGFKSSISRRGKPGEYQYRRANGKPGNPRAPSYGQWITRPVKLGFNPMPKRAGVNEDGLTLALREMPADLESTPYKKALLSEEALALLMATVEILEQPDADLSDYEVDTKDS